MRDEIYTISLHSILLCRCKLFVIITETSVLVLRRYREEIPGIILTGINGYHY